MLEGRLNRAKLTGFHLDGHPLLSCNPFGSNAIVTADWNVNLVTSFNDFKAAIEVYGVIGCNQNCQVLKFLEIAITRAVDVGLETT